MQKLKEKNMLKNIMMYITMIQIKNNYKKQLKNQKMQLKFQIKKLQIAILFKKILKINNHKKIL